jgi:GDPmannose 4,6-dehydratase
MTCVFVIGVTGQDGFYLAEHLLDNGQTVIGITRDEARARDALVPLADGGLLETVAWDMESALQLEALVKTYKPTRIFNFGALSSGAGMFDDAPAIGRINGLAVTTILEAIRKFSPQTRFCQAASSELYGNPPLESPQTEETPLRPRSPYGAAKLYAHAMVRIYREHYGLFGCSAILFNHESPRRKPHFVTRKITRAAAAIKLGLEKELRLGDLDARRDWGFAGDYVRAMALMLNAPSPDDYVVAAGETHAVRDLCAIAFEHAGLDYRDYVRQDAQAMRKPEPVQLVGCAAKLRRQLGWAPRVTFAQMVRMMVDTDLAELGGSGEIAQTN